MTSAAPTGQRCDDVPRDRRLPVPDTTTEDLWAAVRAERAALAGDLADVPAAEWARPSLCGRWSVEDVVAHLSSAASAGRVRWLTSIVGARFDADVHNDRRLAEHRGATPAGTLERFRSLVTSTTAPSGHTAAWLGEVVVHAQDVRRPLGLPGEPPVPVVTEVARFYAARDFAVSSRTAAAGLRLEATDGPFTAGEGPLVTGTTLALTMAMAGREVFCDELTGAGSPVLRARCPRS
ncbi:maleylpyruvate isomerase family mycothiol-dependent enzyme [uncultured Pseudokineococcus sp.]|uniref:maleylpyruvate isomerase family mycothiol-dependent enzyme n=1 Tax=uncultured Pseudokineococcus sp. TaxID=1642928 RepID=UPI002616A52D|nr:maleylpyruvate isomerase family mycothiol-dependent enzyme [uncultured Pseudokineococcus sp.]